MLIDLLQRAAQDAPDQPAAIFGERAVDYATCLRRSQAFANGLDKRGLERFAMVVQHPADVLSLLAASSAVGSEACIYPAFFTGPEANRLASTFGHSAIVTDRDIEPSGAETIELEALGAAGSLESRKSEDSTLMVLTTGTTGNQRGVRHRWSRVLRTLSHADAEAGSRWLLAYNLNQFGGLQVLLHALASRATLVDLPSRQPNEIVATIRRERVTRVSATPTFWRLLVTALSDADAKDLGLEQITLGGEPVSDALLGRLKALFPDAQLSQIYGATETGTAVSVRDGRSGLPAAILERDEDADVRVRIVDGELQMKSRVGMLGYHGDEAREQGWRPTGDLVELRGDRIHFVGRRSEVINVGGAKVHPFPIEEAVSALEGVELAAAYGRPNRVTGQIVAVDVVASPGADTEKLRRAIVTACQEVPPAARPRLIQFVTELDIRGDKVARGAGAAHGTG